MPFNSYGFIYGILPVALLGFYGLRWGLGKIKSITREQRCAVQKLWLIAVSVYFLGQFGVRNVIVLAGSIAWNGVFLYLLQNKGERKGLLPAAVIGNVAFLGFFKYSGIWFPVAISFYTFEQLAVLLDVSGRNGRHPGRKIRITPLSYLLYVLYFPKLLEGPIARYETLSPQFDAMPDRKFDAEQFLRGCMLFAIGLGKKVLLADQLGQAVDVGFAEVTTLMPMDALFVTIAFSLQLYFDFSGYCDMGEGVSRMLGITLPRNFNSPFQSETTGQHWDRWHMTLTSFFTDYIYIPLGGSRKGSVLTVVNIMLVFLISGLWHGNTLPFVVWGVLQGILLVIYRMLNLKPAKGIVHAVRVAIQFSLWSLCMVIFRGATLTEGLTMLSRYGAGKWKLLFATKAMLDAAVPDELHYVFRYTALHGTVWSTIVGAWGILLVGLAIVFWGKNSYEIAVDGKLTWGKIVATALLFVFSALSMTGISTFLYMNF